MLAAAASASAQHPGRHLESRRASAPVVYLATVAAVRETGPADAAGTPARMEATLAVGRVFRPAALPGPAPAQAVVRYEQAGGAADGVPAGMSYRLAAGDRALVFAAAFVPAFPIEMIAGPPKAVAAQVKALRDYLAAMDEATAQLHGVTPAVKAQQTALYDRVLGDLGGARAR